MRNRILLFGIYFLYSYAIVAQERNYKSFTEDNGLPSSTIYSIFQDSKGYLWFSTDNGISKYDGYEFNNYTVNDGLADNEIFNFFEDSKGRIWFYSYNGSVSYYYNNKFYNSTNDSILIKLNSSSMITDIIEDDNKIFIASYNDGIYVFNTTLGSAERYFQIDRAFEHLSGLLDTSEDIIDIVSYGGVKQYSIVRNITLKDNRKYLPSNEPDFYSSKVIKISPEKYWISNINLIYENDPNSDTLKVHIRLPKKEFYINNLSKIDNDVWICTTNGAIKYSITSNTFSKPILPGYSITCVTKDNENNLWFGTLGNGVKFLSINEVYGYNNERGRRSYPGIKSLYTHSNLPILFVTGDNKIGFITNTLNLSFDKVNNEKLNRNKGINHIAFDNNNLWIASNLNIFLIKNYSIYDQLPLATKDILVDGDSIWLASTRGLYILPKSVYLKYKNVGYVSPYLEPYRRLLGRSTKLFRDSNYNTWVVNNNTVYLNKKDESRLKRIKQLDGIHVNKFAEYDNRYILLATNGLGVVGFDYSDSAHLKEVNTLNGLSNNISNGITVDSDSIIWVATNEGLNKILGFPDSIKIEHYDTFDGLSSDLINDILIKEDTIWLATNKGLDFFLRSDFMNSSKVPIMQIESISINDRTINEVDSIYNLSYNQNDIQIKFVGISLSSNGIINYRYKFNEGASWKYTKGRLINFSSLSPGEYYFTIQASNKFGVWSDSKNLRINILKPFWETYWFISLFVLVLASLISLIVRQVFRNQKLKSEQKQKVISSELKSLKAQINPHFVFNALNSIQGELLKNEPEVALNYLGKLGRLMRKVLDHSEQLYVDVSEEINIITDYLDTEKFKTGNKFAYTIEVSSEVDQKKMVIPSMIIQPFVENSIWHGFSGQDKMYLLTIRFSLINGNELEVKIIDNGIGRDKASKLTRKNHNSKGLDMVKERFDALNYGKIHKMTFYIEDTRDQNNQAMGTVVTLRIPQI